MIKTKEKKSKTFWKLITGPMFSAKTKHLIKEINYFQKKLKKKLPVFKPYIDDRLRKKGNEKINTHDLNCCKAIVIKKNEEIWDFINKKKEKPEIIFISEFSLFSEGIVDVLEKIQTQGINIICEGINKDYKGNHLPAITKLLKKEIKIKTLFSNCYNCFNKAEYSKRIVAEKKTILIGGKESYLPACHKCWKIPI